MSGKYTAGGALAFCHYCSGHGYKIVCEPEFDGEHGDEPTLAPVSGMLCPECLGLGSLHHDEDRLDWSWKPSHARSIATQRNEHLF
jgi:hypothetical protein